MSFGNQDPNAGQGRGRPAEYVRFAPSRPGTVEVRIDGVVVQVTDTMRALLSLAADLDRLERRLKKLEGA